MRYAAGLLGVLFALFHGIPSAPLLAEPVVPRGIASAAAVVSVGAVGIWALAIANEFWIHGHPTVSHSYIEGKTEFILRILREVGLTQEALEAIERTNRMSKIARPIKNGE